MTVAELIKRLEALEHEQDFEVYICTETEEHGQVEQKVGDVAMSLGRVHRRVILVPPGF